MSNFSEQQKVRETLRQEVREKAKTSRETLGKFFYDLAKIVFTALVVGSIASVLTEEKDEYWLLIAIGLLVTFLFSYIGYKTIKN